MVYKNRNIISGLLAEKCPRCRQGNIFIQRGVFPLKSSLEMKTHCTACNQKFKTEHNYGQGMNFVFIIIIFLLTLCWYWPVFGLSYMDNSVFYYIGTAAFFCIILQPWLMRFSRVLFLYLTIKYEGEAALQEKAGAETTGQYDTEAFS